MQAVRREKNEYNRPDFQGFCLILVSEGGGRKKKNACALQSIMTSISDFPTIHAAVSNNLKSAFLYTSCFFSVVFFYAGFVVVGHRAIRRSQ